MDNTVKQPEKQTQTPQVFGSQLKDAWPPNEERPFPGISNDEEIFDKVG